MECNTLGNARIESIGSEHIWHQSGVEDTVRQSVPQSGELPGSVTIKRTSKKGNNQKNFQDESQSKVLPGSAAIMGTVRQYYKKSIQGVLQLKVHKGSVAIKSSARECHNSST